MLSTFIKELKDDTSGATAIEYGLIVSLIVIALIGDDHDRDVGQDRNRKHRCDDKLILDQSRD
jgi:Flp/Fap pilin component